MIDGQQIVRALHEASDSRVAHRRMKQLRPLRGIRGVAPGEVARIAAEAWREGVALERDAGTLAELFGGGHEDGLVAMGLCAAAAQDAPETALELAEEWLAHVDDLETADALGWIVLGSASTTTSTLLDWSVDLAADQHVVRRRVGVAVGLAMTLERIEGPAASPLRERLGARHVAIGHPPGDVSQVVSAYVHDESPHVQKALARLLRAWSALEPDTAQAWAASLSGGTRRSLSAAIAKGVRRGERNTSSTVVCVHRMR